MTGNCWQLLRVIGRGGDYLNTPLKDGDRFVFDEKEKSGIAASFFNNKETGRALQKKADGVRIGLQDSREYRIFQICLGIE